MRKTQFSTDLFDEAEAQTKSLAGWLVPKVKDRSNVLAYDFAKHVVPLFKPGSNKLELWIELSCFPDDLMKEDQIEVDVARVELAIQR